MADNNISKQMLPADFEKATDVVVNFPLNIQNLTSIQIQGLDVYVGRMMHTKSDKLTYIDMHVEGMHVEEGLVEYMSQSFLGYVCDSEGENWYCSCSEASIDYMPDIKLKLQDNPKYFSFSSKDYFEYPYYDGVHTLPARCKLSFQSRLQSNGDADDDSYTLG